MNNILSLQKCVSIFIIGLLFFFSACSDNSTGPDGNGLGEVTLTVSGDVEAQRTGQADFDLFSAANLYTWSLEFHDHSPQTFSLSFNHISQEEIDRPGADTYEIGIGQGALPWEDPRPMSFYGEYVHIVDQDFENATYYNTGFCEDEYPSGGTLTISSSSSDQITGSFQFTAHNIDFDNSGNCVNNGTVEVEGEFTATPRIGA